MCASCVHLDLCHRRVAHATHESGLGRRGVVVCLVVLQALRMALLLRLWLGWLLKLPPVVILLLVILRAAVIVSVIVLTVIIFTVVALILSATGMIVLTAIAALSLSAKILIAAGATTNVLATETASLLAAVQDDAAHVDIPLRDFLVRFADDVCEVNQDGPTALIHIRQRVTSLAASAGPSDSMDVVVNMRWTIKLNNCFHVWDVQSSSSDIGCDQDVDVASSELVQRALAVALVLVPVDHHAREVLLRQKSLQLVCALLRLREYENSRSVIGRKKF